MPDQANTHCPACAHPANDHAGPHGCAVDRCPCVLNPFTVGTLIGRAAHQAGVPGPHLHLGPPDTYVQTGPHNCHHDPGPYDDSPVKITGSNETTDSRFSLENARRELAQQIADVIGPARFWKDPAEPSQILNRIANDIVHPILYGDEERDAWKSNAENRQAKMIAAERRAQQADEKLSREGDEWEAMYTEAVERAERAEVERDRLSDVLAKARETVRWATDQSPRRARTAKAKSEGRREAFTEIAEWADGRINTFACDDDARNAYRSALALARLRADLEGQR